MKVLKVVYTEDDVINFHEYDEHHTYARMEEELIIGDVTGARVASYNWPCVVYVRYEGKAEG